MEQIYRGSGFVELLFSSLAYQVPYLYHLGSDPEAQACLEQTLTPLTQRNTKISFWRKWHEHTSEKQLKSSSDRKKNCHSLFTVLEVGWPASNKQRLRVGKAVQLWSDAISCVKAGYPGRISLTPGKADVSRPATSTASCACDPRYADPCSMYRQAVYKWSHCLVGATSAARSYRPVGERAMRPLLAPRISRLV